MLSGIHQSDPSGQTICYRQPTETPYSSAPPPVLPRSAVCLSNRWVKPLSACIHAALDLVNEHIAAPAVLNRLADVPFALVRYFHHVQDSDVVAPGNLSNNLLDN